MSSPKKNFIYNLIYEALILIIPLITAPYLSRVVGAQGVGTYAYTYSIVNYFMILTLLGVRNYGNRTIAKTRDNNEKLSKTFWSIYSFQIIMGILMLLLYIGYTLFFNPKYKTIALIQTLFVVSAIFDINWLFFGLEEFKKTIIRNSIIKICSLVLIFLLVKSPDDLWKYTLIMSGMTLISQLVLWPFALKKIKRCKITFKDIIKHIKPNLILFVPVIAVSLYKIMDKIMLGILTDVKEVGYYENAEKIISIPLTLITALGTVMLPRMTNIISKGKEEEASSYTLKSISFVMFMSCAMCFGLIGIGYKFAPIYFGNDFQKTGILIMILAITLPIISFANVIRTQHLIPREKDKIYIISVFLGAVVNLVLNAIFIPRFDSIGACIGTITAEFIVMLYQILAVKKNLPIGKYLTNSIPFILKSIIMLALIIPINYFEINDYFKIIIQVVLGVVIYGLLNTKYILSIIDFRKLINKLKKVFNH